MTRFLRPAVLAAGLAFVGLAFASPALAYSLTPTPPGAEEGAKLADPDEALSGLYKHFVGSAEPAERPKPEQHGAMATYDLSNSGKKAKAHDGLADLSRSPGDSDFNPFMADRLQDDDRQGR